MNIKELKVANWRNIYVVATNDESFKRAVVVIYGNVVTVIFSCIRLNRLTAAVQ